MKKIFSLFLVFVLLLSTAMLMASCSGGSKGLAFRSNGDGTCSVVNNNESLFSVSGNIVIPETSPDGDRVTRISGNAFMDCHGLKSVTIPDSVTEIGDFAFRNCIGLKSVTIPDSVTRIGTSAFGNCDSLTSLLIPDSVVSIGMDAFSGCPDSCFNTYKNMKYVGNDQNPYYALIEPIDETQSEYSIHDNTRIIEQGAFSGIASLKSIVIPDSVIVIDDRAFFSNTGLKSITIGDGVTSIGYQAFYECTGLESVIIGNSVTSIGDDAFSDCYALTDVYFGGTQQEWDDLSESSGVPENATVHYNYVPEQ